MSEPETREGALGNPAPHPHPQPTQARPAEPPQPWPQHRQLRQGTSGAADTCRGPSPSPGVLPRAASPDPPAGSVLEGLES